LNTIQDIQEFLKDDIKSVEKCMLDQANGYFPDFAVALELLLSSGGKRIRPIIALLTGKMLNGDNQRLIMLASAIELLHTATLVHDDLIDEALLRRGNPTLNAKWSTSATILTGDFLFSCAAKLAADTDSLAVMKLFSQTLITIVNGEITQLLDPYTEDRKKTYYERIYSKTASLFETSACAAAIISTNDQQTINDMKEYGCNLGLAFQIIDDVLDFTGNEKNIGKPVGSDIKQGIITLPAIIYAETHPEDILIKNLLSKNKLGNGEIDQLVQSINNSNSIEQSLLEAKKHTEIAINKINSFNDSYEKELLIELAYFLTQRDI